MAEATHSELIQDQFTRQAGVFNAAGTITNEQALKMIIEAGQAGSNDTVLDVACGGGIADCVPANVLAGDVSSGLDWRHFEYFCAGHLCDFAWDRGTRIV